MDFIFGVIGFLGFEALRIYKKVINGECPIPSNMIYIYIITIVVIGIFSGVVAMAMEPQVKAYAIFIGFSVPSSIKAILGKNSNDDIGSRTRTIEVDDIETETIEEEKLKTTITQTPYTKYKRWIVTYFSY